jgi:hypothetical protein
MKIILCIWFILFGLPLFAENKYVTAEKPIPAELKLLFQSIPVNSLSEEDKLLFEKSLLVMDQNFPLLSKEEVFFLCKTEIYKTILKKHKEKDIDLKLVDGKFIRQIDQKMDSIKGNPITPFSTWLILAILSDYKQLISAPQNLSFVALARNGSKSKDRSFLIWEKKMKMIFPWIELFLASDFDEFETISQSLRLEILKILSQYSSLIIKHTKFKNELVVKKSTINSLQFFKWKTIQEKTPTNFFAEEDQASSVPTPIPGWTPKDSPVTPESDQQGKSAVLPPNYPTPSTNYSPPEKLPEPVNDWIEEF